MAELSAAEILHAQLNHEVAEAKATFDPELGSAVENLAEAVCRRWWLSRMLKRHDAPADVSDLRERMNKRMQALEGAVKAMITQTGGVDIGAMQVLVLSMSAEVNALWGALIESGMMTPSNRQDYMDQAVENLCKRVNEQARKIMVPGSARAS